MRTPFTTGPFVSKAAHKKEADSFAPLLFDCRWLNIDLGVFHFSREWSPKLALIKPRFELRISSPESKACFDI
jgi:hypothetical protein